MLCLPGNIWTSLLTGQASQKIATGTQKTDDALKYYCIKSHTSQGKINIHIIEIDPKKYSIKLALAGNRIGRSATMREMVKNNPQISAAINGTFFTLTFPSLPISNIMIDHKMIFFNNLKRTACGITKDNELFFGIPEIKGLITIEGSQNWFYVWGMNRPRKSNAIIVYTKEYGAKTSTRLSDIEIIVKNNEVVDIKQGNNTIPEDGFVIAFNKKSEIINWLPIGTKINLQFTLNNGWENAEQIFTGGPRLIQNGKIVVSEAIKKEKFRGYLLHRHPRSAIGLTKNNKVLLVVVDGRQKNSVGVTYYKLAHILSDLGAIEAMGLDGGNSSIMWFKGKIVNSPGNGGRRISNAVIVISPNK